MIRFCLRWLWRLVLLLVVVVGVLMAPVGYVEFACTGEDRGDGYAAILPEAHHRLEARTLLTYPEWHIVHVYDDYAQVIDAGDPHDFGYVKAVRSYWSSLCALKKQAASHGGIDGSTRQLVYVIGVSFSAELALKAAYEETLGRVATWVRGAQHSPLDDLSAEQAADYAAFLQQVPWYKWDFQSDIAALEAARTEAFRDRERRFALGTEYAAKSAYAGVIAGAVANVGADELTLRMIVSGPDSGEVALLDGVTITALRPEGMEIETIRYRALTHLLTEMAALDVHIIEMAGNDDIMFTALSPQAEAEGALFSFPRQGYGDHRHLFMVKVPDLLDRLRAMRDGALRVEHVHDY